MELPEAIGKRNVFLAKQGKPEYEPITKIDAKLEKEKYLKKLEKLEKEKKAEERRTNQQRLRAGT